MTETTDHTDIPDALRFDLDDRAPDTREGVTFALGDNTYVAYKPLDYTMLVLSSAMSGMSDGGDRAYAIMVFCHDVFDSPTRDVVRKLPGDKLLDLIQNLCEHWDTDTSTWQREPGNRATRRATAAKKTAKRR